MRNIKAVVLNGKPTKPFFYSFAGSPNINVFDPDVNGAYVYFDFPAPDFMFPPEELDALTIFDDGERVDHDSNPATPDRLIYRPYDPAMPDMPMPGDGDVILFSVGRGEINMPWTNFSPCDVLRLHLNAVLVLDVDVYRTCEQLGLDPDDPVDPRDAIDNLDALDVGAGIETGAPIIEEQVEPPPCPGDRDMDGDVDLSDLGLVLASFGFDSGGDQDGDGDTDLSDLGIVLSNFGFVCP
jgi:hypothetical protein